jgi:hypothetical protein
MAASKSTQPIQGAPPAAQHSTLDGLAAILLGLPACSQKGRFINGNGVCPPMQRALALLGVMPVRLCRLLAA